jgi:hypothetical protein
MKVCDFSRFILKTDTQIQQGILLSEELKAIYHYC